MVWSVTNYQNHQDKFDGEWNANQKELEDASMDLLNICSSAVGIGDLESCKNESIPKLIEMCNDDQNSNLSICSDVRLKEFANTVDERIKSAEIHVDELLNNLNKAQLRVIELCFVGYEPSCKNSMLNIKNECMKIELRDISSCNDSRIQMILDKESDIGSTSGQVPLNNEQQAEYARIIRDCSRENEITAEEYLTKFANVDTLSEKQEDSIQSNSERVSICSADIREIESSYCYLFNPSCTETGRFETYWNSVVKIQLAYEQICANTGKFCNYAFHKN